MTNEDVIKLAELNKKLNSFNEISNAKQVFSGERDERDPIIDRILSGEDIYAQINGLTIENKRINGLAIEMSQYYFKTYGDDIDYTYFIDFIEQIVRILLKNFKLYDDIKEPRAFMANYLFKQKVGNFKNRVWAYFNKYYPKYFEPFKGHKSLDQMMDNQRYDKYDADFHQSNKSYINFYELGANSKYDKDIININIETDDLENIIEEEELLYSKDEDEDNDVFVIPNAKSYPTVENAVITKYDIPFEKIRIKNIELTDQEYSKKINKSRKNKINSWRLYNAETGYFPCNITKYQTGINNFLLRDNKDEREKFRDNKETDLIFAVCKPEPDFDFSEISFDKTTENYLRKIITENLKERPQMLIKHLYYEMMPVDDVVSKMGFSSKTAMNKEKNRSLILLKYKLLSDFDYIIAEYGDTKLAYWVKLLKKRHEKEVCEKEGKKVI